MKSHDQRLVNLMKFESGVFTYLEVVYLYGPKGDFIQIFGFNIRLITYFEKISRNHRVQGEIAY